MTRGVLPFLVISSACLFLQAETLAQDWYLVPAGVYTDDDELRQVDDEIAGGQLTLGRFLTDHFAIEGVVGSSALSDADELDLLEYGLNGVFAYRRDRLISPYFLLGFGVLDRESILFVDEDADFFNVGAGLNVRFGNSPLSLRLEHRIRHLGGDGDSLSDGITSLGLGIAFGRKDTPAPPVAPEPDGDSDGDGVSDGQDSCPDTPAGHEVDARGCSLDSDGDGVADADDQCPNTFRGATVDARGCELDDDGDGVVNHLDQCPDTAAGVRVDVKGCEIKDVINLPGVNFETNSDRLLPGADNVLRDAAATLRKYPELVVEVAGYTDSAGAADYNQGLSERRANTVRDYLINEGVAGNNLSANGYGEAGPIADNATAEGRARNRRVELRIVEEN